MTGAYDLPIDPGIARIGGCDDLPKYDKDFFAQIYPARITRQLLGYTCRQLGFFIHAQCWVLLNQVIDTTLVERKLDKFIRAARKYWRQNPKLWGIHVDRGWSSISAEEFPFRSTSIYGCDISQNPLIVLEVQKAIDRASNVQENLPRSCFSKVPLDVAIIIAEFIFPSNYTTSDARNTHRMLSSFRWRLPNWFWERRLRGSLLLELDKARPANSPIDWQALGLELICLLSDEKLYNSSGLANRERVFVTRSQGCLRG